MPPKPCPTRDPLHFRIAMRETFGAASLRTSRRLTLSSSVMEVTPVTLPPGRERLATSPCSTASSDDPITIGIVLVALLAASVSAPAVVRMRSTFNWTNSVARAGRRSSRNSAHRRSTTMFCPFYPTQLTHRLPEGLRRSRFIRGEGRQDTDPRECHRLLRFCGEWSGQEADRENDREPNHPHAHLGEGWLAGSLADLNYSRFTGSSVSAHICRSARRSPETFGATQGSNGLRSSPAPVWILKRNIQPGEDRLERPVGVKPCLVCPGQLGLLDEFVHLLHHAGPHLEQRVAP